VSKVRLLPAAEAGFLKEIECCSMLLKVFLLAALAIFLTCTPTVAQTAAPVALNVTYSTGGGADAPRLLMKLTNTSGQVVRLRRLMLPWATDVFAMPIIITEVDPPKRKLKRQYTVSHAEGTLLLSPGESAQGEISLLAFKGFEEGVARTALIVAWRWRPEYADRRSADELSGRLTIGQSIGHP